MRGVRSVLVLCWVAFLVLVGSAPVSARSSHAPSAPRAAKLGFLWPLNQSVAFGTVRLAVRYVDTHGRTVQSLSFYEQYFDQGIGQTVRRLIGTDHTGSEPSFGPACRPSNCFVPNVWSMAWRVPRNHPEGVDQIFAKAKACNGTSCRKVDAGTVVVRVEPTPPLPTWTSPKDHAMLQPPDCTVKLKTTVNDGNVTNVAYYVAPLAFTTGKGLPFKDQHVDGAELSGDTDEDGSTGNMSCAPTATASSLAWFAAHGYPGIMPDGMTNKELTEAIGGLADTNDDGTDPEDLAVAIHDYLNAVGLGGAFNVEMEEDPPMKSIADEFGQGQDVMLGFNYDDGGGHMVTVNDIAPEPNPDGTTTVQIMDPWDGTYKDIRITPDGDTVYEGDTGTIGVKVAVSPVGHPAGSTFIGDATLSGDTYRAPWDVSTVTPGWYLLEAQGSDATGLSFSSYQIVYVLDCTP